MKQKLRNIAAWILQVLVGLEFSIAGLAKFTNSKIWAQQFEGWGYPDHFYMLIGGLELILAVLVFFPRYSAKAALGLGVIMLGATLTHAIHQEWNRVWVTVIITGIIALLYYLRKGKSANGADARH
ncbi:MAG: DoxX family protein [Lewinella sp.]|nr:DoxX family protein [Lewinella sp.]